MFVRNLSVLLKKNGMSTSSTSAKTRFDTRLPKEQKLLFERAARLGGYRSLSDFIILTVQGKAKEIIREREQIIASEKDSKIFFNAIVSPGKANKNLLSAAKDFKTALQK